MSALLAGVIVGFLLGLGAELGLEYLGDAVMFLARWYGGR